MNMKELDIGSQQILSNPHVESKMNKHKTKHKKKRLVTFFVVQSSLNLKGAY